MKVTFWKLMSLWSAAAVFAVVEVGLVPPAQPLPAAGPMPAASYPPRDPPKKKEESPDAVKKFITGLSDRMTKVEEQVKKEPVKVALLEPPPPQPAPVAPVVAPEKVEDASDPQIVVEVTDGAGKPATNRPAGKIIVVSLGKSKNYKRMLVDITPAVPEENTYYTPDHSAFVFSAPEEGTWTISIVASSPTGGLSRAVTPITVGEPEQGGGGGPSPTRSIVLTPKQFDYGHWVTTAVRKLQGQNRKGDAKAMAGAFRSALGLMQTGGVRSVAELFEATNTFLVKALGPDAAACKPFMAEAQLLFQSDIHDLDRGSAVWSEVARALERYAGS